MSRLSGVNAQTIAELVVQLGRITHSSGYVSGLTPAQWSALRYLSRANRFSRTVSAFAEYRATTRGTASQTVKALVALGYLSRKRSRQDGRSARLELTDKARTALASDPGEDLVRAANALSATARGHVATGLQRLLGYLAQGSGKRLFGVCTFCKHLDEERCHRDGMSSFGCTFFGELLEEAELERICVNFQPNERSAVRRAHDRKSPS